MGKETICVIDRSDLVSMLSELYEGRFDGREVDSHTATQILGISKSTLDRWIDRNLIRVNNAGEKELKGNLIWLICSRWMSGRSSNNTECSINEKEKGGEITRERLPEGND